jgi:hypothetical protein
VDFLHGVNAPIVTEKKVGGWESVANGLAELSETIANLQRETENCVGIVTDQTDDPVQHKTVAGQERFSGRHIPSIRIPASVSNTASYGFSVRTNVQTVTVEEGSAGKQIGKQCPSTLHDSKCHSLVEVAFDQSDCQRGEVESNRSSAKRLHMEKRP